MAVVRPIAKPHSPVLNRKHPLARNRVACWPMWEAGGVTTRDIAGAHYDGILDSDVDWVASVYGPVCQFATYGTGQITVPVVNHNILTGDFTWAMVARIDADSSWNIAASNGSYSPAFILQEPANAWGLYWAPGHAYFDTSLAVGQWYHLAVVRRDGVIYGYVDGVQEPTTRPLTHNFANAVHTFGVWNDGGASVLDGTLALALLANRGWSDSEVRIWAADPFALVRRARRRVFSVAAAAAGTILPQMMAHEAA